MSEPGSAVDELQPWSTRALRRVGRGVRTAWLAITGWLSGWGVGGVLVVLLVVAVLAIFVFAPLMSRHSGKPPCDQASGVVGRIENMQFAERRVTLDRDMVRDLHRYGARLKPIGDDAYGSVKSPLTELAALASGAQVGDHLRAQSVLDQIDNACPRH